MTTEKQKSAVAFCEQVLDIEFAGDINDFQAVSVFLFDYLDEAKSIADEAFSSYYSNFEY